MSRNEKARQRVKTKMTSILHVVVHAGFLLSFENALESVSRHTTDDVLGI